ncbi:MAG: hypothetical protein AAGA56_29060, partial [Myxococcota bacterium]
MRTLSVGDELTVASRIDASDVEVTPIENDRIGRALAPPSCALDDELCAPAHFNRGNGSGSLEIADRQEVLLHADAGDPLVA